ncbi:MAG: glycosyltransferase family 4 protein, partial [Anaerolineae bacterium]|nr:glycosyltransferase family 4 protein [Anaerolineae bacterium]
MNLQYGIALDRIAVIYNAVPPLPIADTQLVRSQLGIPNELFLIGSVGRLDMPKNYAALVETAVIILQKRQDIMFLLVG